jgi:hypothetical protein
MSANELQLGVAPHALSGHAFVEIHQLAMRAQEAEDVEQLGFTMVNETLGLLNYRQAAFFRTQLDGSQATLAAASGLANVGHESPFAVWLSQLVRALPQDQPGAQTACLANAPAELADGWAEWLPEHVVHTTLRAPSGAALGGLLLARETPWTPDELASLALLNQHYSYCLWSLGQAQRRWLPPVSAQLKTRTLRWSLPALALVLLMPVRLSALAPAEVVPLNAMAVAAPQDGVVARFHVQPNSAVKKGDLLFSLDDTTLRSRHDVASKALAVAQAEALAAQQRAFEDNKSKGDLASILGRVREKESELAQIQAAMARLDVTAERDGLAIYSDPNEWTGRPVQTGERVMQLADPKDAGLQVWLPTNDALNLEAGAPMRLFLHTQPLQPVSASLMQTSYQASLSPDGIASYRLKGRFNPDEVLPRMGLRGTARVSGDWSVLGYYLFRRPLAALREWTGL